MERGLLRLPDSKTGARNIPLGAPASVAAMAGDSLLLIGKVLGHKQASTTERYAHLQDDPVRAVADRTARKIAAAMSGHSPNDVLRFKR